MTRNALRIRNFILDTELCDYFNREYFVDDNYGDYITRSVEFKLGVIEFVND